MATNPVVRLLFLSTIVVSLASSRLLAEEKEPSPPDTDAPTSVSPNQVGVTMSAMRGIHRVGIPVSSAPAIHVAASGGYGVTESIGTPEGTHHRLRGVVSASASIFPWLAFGFNLDGRYDIHPSDDTGKDSGFVGDPRIVLRGGYPIHDLFQLGAEVGVWVPGKDAPSLAWDATTVDAKLLGALTLPNLTVAAQAGFRFDNSANSAPDPTRLRPGDHLSLGVSEFHSVLAGLGISYRISDFEILGELTWDVLVGDRAPSPADSPIRLNIGSRYNLNPIIAFEFLTETALNGRPGIAPNDPLVPIEPRFSVLLGVRAAWSFAKNEKVHRDAAPIEAPPPVLPTTTRVQGRVVDMAGNPIPNTLVKMSIGAYSEETTTDAEGKYQFEDVPVGQARITVSAEGFNAGDWVIQTEANMPEVDEKKLSPVEAASPGSQLRGLVRSFTGKYLNATITIDPSGLTTKTDKEGFFQIDIPPGSYQVTIEAIGYKKQTRSVKVEENGVSILNVDLRK